VWGTLEREPRNRLPEVQALPLFKQIFQGVRFLHTNGIAHRDLSLENVLLSHNNNGGGAGAFGTPKICDFGLSTDSDQTCRERVGKNYYMAPEVVAGDAYNPRAADMWSLGIILFVMLTGSPLTPLASEKEEAFVALKEFGIERIVETWHMSDLVSRATMDLLVGLLQIDPFARFTAEDVVVHRALMDL
jgi:serine/threonine protein kinase